MNRFKSPLIVLICLLAAGVAAEDDVISSVRDFIIASVKAGRQQTEIPGAFGKVRLVSADAKGIVPESATAGKMDLAWKALTDKDLYAMSRGLLQEGDVDGHLTVARLALKLGVGGEMDKALEKLQQDKPEAVAQVQPTRDQIAAQVAPQVVIKPPPKQPSDPAPKPEGTVQAPGPPLGPQGANHEGRMLPPLPRFKDAVLYNTPEADAIVAAMQIFPKDNPWNQDISRRPVAANSDKIIEKIGTGRSLHVNHDMTYVLVPPNQPRIELVGNHYKGESDKGPYPIPDNTPIEGWPSDYPKQKLDDVQRNGDGDRHMSVVDPFNGMVYEFYQGRKVDSGWQASGEATFDLKSNKLRPKGWTSSDAAGLPIFPAIVRFDECERGMVEHALRFTVPKTRRGWIYPARHEATRNTDPDLPTMGQRLRLKANVDLGGLPKHALAIALALKKYGMFVADHGSAWFISTSGDSRLKGLEALHKFKGSDFEVIEPATEPAE